MKVGGAIGLIGGIFGVFAALSALSMGGMSVPFQADQADGPYLLFGAVVLSFVAIVLGAVAIGSQGRLFGMLLIIGSIGGAVLSGTLIAVFMVLAFIGGLLVAAGGGSAAVSTAM